jgi:hypothetical protein
MAEIQQSTHTADITQRFIEFVMMQAQQAALCLGQMAHPSTGKAEVNLDAAKMFIDHLEIVSEKTRGNLTKDEEKILSSVLTELRLAYVQVSGGHPGGADLSGAASLATEPELTRGEPEPLAVSPPEEVSKSETTSSREELPEDKKKFTKSYGA